MSYDDTVLIKLRRQYKKDEVVLHLIKLVKESKVEIGKLNAYIDEIKHKNLESKRLIKSLEKKLAENNKLHVVRLLEEKLKKSNLENERLKKINANLRLSQVK